MTQWNKIKPLLVKFVNAGLYMMGGAWLLTQYLRYTDPAQEQALQWLDHGLTLLIIIGLALSSNLNRQPDIEGLSVKDPSPRWSGVAPVLMTGFALAGATLLSGDASDFVLLPVMIMVGTILSAFLVWRFASKNADEIGEARFNSKPSAN